MRKNMKLIGLAVCLTCCAGFINAQEANEPQERQQEKRLPREVLNPEKVMGCGEDAHQWVEANRL